MSEPSISIQPRDLDILRSLLESRILTLKHIAEFHFEGSEEAAKQRLQKLKTAGFIAERRRRVNERSILFPARKGFALLQSHGILRDYPAPSIPALEKRSQVAESTIRHELEVLDVKAAIIAGMRGMPNFSVAEFSTWPQMNEFKASPSRDAAPKPVLPDGFLHVREQEKEGEPHYRYFLEVDRSHESQEVLALKCACYTEYYRSGRFAVRNGGTAAKPEQFPFRILVVLKSAERRNNTTARLLQNNPPILRQAYLSTLEEVKANPFGEIWIRPLDYRNAVDGTSFESYKNHRSLPYKRQIERERVVENKIRKLNMLADEV